MHTSASELRKVHALCSVVLSLALLAFLSPPVIASVVYVDADAAGPTYDGSSWEAAYADLQDALAMAAAGDEIRVAQGKYKPDSGSLDRTMAFQLLNDVEVYGGYAGPGYPDPDDWDPVAYPTTLSADLNDDDTAGRKDDNAYHVVSGSGTDDTALICGFVIEGGYADGSLPDDRGAGMIIEHGDCSVADCNFIDNHAMGMSSMGGGGLYVYSGEPVLVGCSFHSNTAPDGGGMTSMNAEPILIDCDFVSNSISGALGGGLGGGLYIQGGSVAMTDCSFEQNVALDAGASGGGMASNEGYPVLTECDFSENEANAMGGAAIFYQCPGWLIRCSFSRNTAEDGGATAVYSGNPQFDECSFSDNSATGYGGAAWDYDSSSQYGSSTFERNSATHDGGGVFALDSHIFSYGCVFLANESEDTGGGFSASGGYQVLVAARFLGNWSRAAGGGMMLFSESDAVVMNSLFSGNVSTVGGGLACASGGPQGFEPQLVNCTFSHNDASDSGGGVLLFLNTSIAIDNGVLWANTDGVSATKELEQIHRVFSTANVSYSCVQGWLSGGTGNIRRPPRFVNSDGPDGIHGTIDDNCKLHRFSHCIDAGDNSVVTWTTDLEGDPRMVDRPRADTGAGVAPIVDMGALEKQ
jgi:predicted outer membrane repeat protein